MSKLRLSVLKVESFAVQPSESELSEVKGGTSWGCALQGMSAMSDLYGGDGGDENSGDNSGDDRDNETNYQINLFGDNYGSSATPDSTVTTTDSISSDGTEYGKTEKSYYSN